MKRFIILFICAIAATGISMAQCLSETFKGNEEMTRLFVSPLGIDNAMSLDGTKAIEEKAAEEGLKCKVSDWGELGRMADISSPGITIGGVKVSDLYIMTGRNMGSIVYQSEPADNYLDMAKYLDKELAGYSRMSDNGDDPQGNFNIYMVGDRYGIAVGTVDAKKTAFAYLVDIKDLSGFMKMGTILMKTITE